MPLSQYKENLKAIVEHPVISAQKPKIIILTPPPVNEYQLEAFDAEKGFESPSRTASNTKQYADACREVAHSLGIPVADIWTAFMKAAGWQDGQPLAGSKEIPKNDILESLLTDGAFSGFASMRVRLHSLMGKSQLQAYMSLVKATRSCSMKS